MPNLDILQGVIPSHLSWVVADNKNKQISWLKFIALSAPSRFPSGMLQKGSLIQWRDRAGIESGFPALSF
jgi:hypothetical protein